MHFISVSNISTACRHAPERKSNCVHIARRHLHSSDSPRSLSIKTGLSQLSNHMLGCLLSMAAGNKARIRWCPFCWGVFTILFYLKIFIRRVESFVFF
jgi:hypothetical protein